jgi:hypothetical protein
MKMMSTKLINTGRHYQQPIIAVTISVCFHVLYSYILFCDRVLLYSPDRPQSCDLVSDFGVLG